MSFIRRCFGLAKVGLYYSLGRRVLPGDYGSEYDAVASSYGMWLDRMSKHTDNLLDLGDSLQTGRPLRIIDLACGTGYITQKLLQTLGSDADAAITCVDVSNGMLEQCREAIHDDRVEFVCADGLAFLSSLEPEKYDAIFCGWGMVYFPWKRLLPLCRRALWREGVMGSIMNCRGTLDGLEDIFIRIMSEYPDELNKVMNLRLNMPFDKDAFISWFTGSGFTLIKSGAGEEVVCFEAPNLLYDWLHDTGVIAGTGKLFRDSVKMEPIILEEIASRFRADTGYRINHKFVYGIYRRI